MGILLKESVIFTIRCDFKNVLGFFTKNDNNHISVNHIIKFYTFGYIKRLFLVHL